jgi:hypothetical protein
MWIVPCKHHSLSGIPSSRLYILRPHKFYGAYIHLIAFHIADGLLREQGCSSPVPRSLKARSGAIRTLAQAKATCKAGDSVCGIEGSRPRSLDYECLDCQTNIGSCAYLFLSFCPVSPPHSPFCLHSNQLAFGRWRLRRQASLPRPLSPRPPGTRHQLRKPARHCEGRLHQRRMRRP